MSLQRRGSTTAGGHGSATKAPKPGKAGAPVSADVTEVLTALAANCEDSYPLQAIHCLMALLQHGRLPKAQEARVRLALARLMLQHTTNAAAAHKELLAAVRHASHAFVASPASATQQTSRKVMSGAVERPQHAPHALELSSVYPLPCLRREQLPRTC